MKLMIDEDGFGHSAQGHRYWRWGERWLRVVSGEAFLSITPSTGWVSGTNAVPGRVMLRYGGDDFVYEVAA